jgi:hypothetical protein
MIAWPSSSPRRILVAALAAFAAVALLAAPEAADAKKKKKKAKSAAGLYVGQFDGMAVPVERPDPKLTFRLTPDGTIVNFVITNVPLACHLQAYGPPTGNEVFYTRLDTIAAPPMSLGAPLPRRGLPLGLRFKYEDPLPPVPPDDEPLPTWGGPPFRGIHIDGRTFQANSKFGGDFRGHANLATFSTTRGVPDSEVCSLTDLGSGGGNTSYDGGFAWFAVKASSRGKKRKR